MLFFKTNIPGPYTAVFGTDVHSALTQAETGSGSGRYVVEWQGNSLQIGRRILDANVLENNQGGAANATFGNFEYVTLGIWGTGVYMTVERITNPSLFKISAIVFMDVSVVKTDAFQWMSEATS